MVAVTIRGGRTTGGVEDHDVHPNQFRIVVGNAVTNDARVWTHPSVRRLIVADEDPENLIIEKARTLIFDAVEQGWEGPPFDPMKLAELNGISLEARADVADARLATGPSGKFVIEFNPERPRNRMRYSIAHEIAHTLFPDAAEEMRHRRKRSPREDDWQLEVLCDVAAAELLMPVVGEDALLNAPVDVNSLVEYQKLYEASMEAVILRVVKLTDTSCAAFASARVETASEGEPAFRIDYCVGSKAWRHRADLRGRVLSSKALARCTAVGYTAQEEERWWSGPKIAVNAVGAPPYPGAIYPRVLGVLLDGAPVANTPNIRYLYGDARKLSSEGPTVIAHIVNDKTPNWGAGFGKSLTIRWPQAQISFRNWVQADKSNLRLGRCHWSTLAEEIYGFHMVAQHGYGVSSKPLIRYRALDACLRQLAEFALKHGARVQMPPIGTGYAGGNWAVIEQLIRERLTAVGIEVMVYRPPDRKLDASTAVREFASQLDLTFPE